jgi:hypothetical protein
VYHLLLDDVVDRFAERRTPYSDAHLKLARTAANNGELLLGRHPLMRSLGYFAYLSFACSVAF